MLSLISCTDLLYALSLKHQEKLIFQIKNHFFIILFKYHMCLEDSKTTIKRNLEINCLFWFIHGHKGLYLVKWGRGRSQREKTRERSPLYFPEWNIPVAARSFSPNYQWLQIVRNNKTIISNTLFPLAIRNHVRQKNTLQKIKLLYLLYE